MNNFINWMNESVTPKCNKFAQNVWAKALQRTMMSSLPIILVASIVNIINSLRVYAPFLPDLGVMYYYIFYLLGLYIAIMLPYYVTEGKRLRKVQVISQITSVGVFLMLQNWQVNPWGDTPILFTNLGPQGMVLAIISGFFVSAIICRLANFSFFKKDTILPEIVASWFNQMLPVTICFLIPYIITSVLGFNILNFVNMIFMPIQSISNTLPGFLLMNFAYVFFYSVGMSGWICSGVFYPILMANIASNAEAIATGLTPMGVATNEVIYSGWIAVGGLGFTLPLVLLMIKSKSKRLNALGKGVLIPSLCNINEPVVYGTPILLNPILMIPMWLNSLVIPTIVYFALTSGFVTVPYETVNLGFIPVVFTCFLGNHDWRSLILLAIVFIVATVIWYPFFKSYETQEIKDEALETAKEK